jgi:hypothetical protein
MKNKIEYILFKTVFIIGILGSFSLMAYLITFVLQPIDLNNGLRGCYEAPGHNDTYKVAVFVTKFLFVVILIASLCICNSLKGDYKKEYSLKEWLLAIGGSIILGVLFYAVTGLFMLIMYFVSLIIFM